jgi:hypothetical protein
VFGDLVALLEPHTEADSNAVLIQAMVAFGNIVGRHAYFVADGTRHYTTVFAVLVAASSKRSKRNGLVARAELLYRDRSGLENRERPLER